MSFARRWFVAAVLAASGAPSVRGGDAASPPPRVPVADPATDEAVDGVPVHWNVFEGAQRGDGPSSSVTVDRASGALVLEGDASTKRWNGASHPVTVKAGTTYRLSFELRATGLRREADQFNSAYVGVTIFGPKTRSATTTKLVEPAGEEWAPHEIVFRAQSERADVVVFLSKTGRLAFRRPVLEELRAGDSFDVMVSHMTRYYAHFDPAIADWSKLVAESGKTFASDAGPAAFSAAAKEMLAALRDPHVWMKVSADAPLIVPYAPPAVPNGDLATVRASIANGKQIGKIAGVGEIGADVGYLLVGSLQGTDAEFAEIDRALDGWRKAGRRILVDLRWNGGGDERRALPIASRFADRERVYARRRVRAGSGLFDLAPPIDARLVPAKDADAVTPVVVLIGPFCMSSGEGMAQMFHALPHVRLVGKPTRGASGNPAPVELPNGVEVWFSRWMNYLPDGTSLEGKGVPPHVLVEHTGPGDPTFVKGLTLLRELTPVK